MDNLVQHRKYDGVKEAEEADGFAAAGDKGSGWKGRMAEGERECIYMNIMRGDSIIFNLYL